MFLALGDCCVVAKTDLWAARHLVDELDAGQLKCPV
jgi:hypothetical protein